MGVSGKALGFLRKEVVVDVPSFKNRVSSSDEEQIKDELLWIADWILERYNHLNYGVVRALLHELVDLAI